MRTDDERAFRQERLKLLSVSILSMLVGVFVAGAIIASFVVPDFDIRNPLVIWGWVCHLGAIAIVGGCWWFLRGRSRSPFALDVVDFVVPLATVAFIGAAVAIRAPFEQGRGDIVLMMGVTSLLHMRAVIVPSTPRRTMIVCVAVLILMPPLFYFIFANDPVFERLAPRMIITFDILWAIVAVWTSTFASRVIFGLRTQMAQVLQLGQYVLDEKLGEGGMGTVYRAKHVLLKRETAVKLLPPEKAGLAAIARFEREVQHTSRLTHPNTVTIFDYGRTPDGVFFYAMEYLDGVDLQRLVETSGPQPASRTVRVLEQVALALAEAHGLGLVHRDVKPANVILCRRGGLSDVVKVVDFGLVKEVEGLGDPNVSGVNTLVGTPLYMPPEHIRSAGAMDARGDLYALGAVGYFMITGVPPFPGRSILEVATQHLHDAPVSPSTRLGTPVPDDLERLILQCLAKRPDDRPASARVLAAQLRAVDVPRWTDDQADGWWREHADRITLLKKASKSSSSLPQLGNRA